MRDLERIKGQILDRLSLVEIVSEHVKLRRQGRRWLGLCPFHAEKSPSFTVNADLGIFKCFGCGKGGDLFSFVQARENVSFMDAMHLLADRAGVEWNVREAGGEARGPGRAELLRVNEWARAFFAAQLRHPEVGAAARDYATRRGISPEMIERFSLGLARETEGALLDAARRSKVDHALLRAVDLCREGNYGLYETFRNRLLFPIRDPSGRVLGFGGRTLGEDKAKYINTSQTVLFDKGRGLYGIDLARARMAETGRAIVVEGYLDCLAAHQAGFTETVASLGTALTDEQVELIRRYCERIILLFDSDRAGEEAAERAIRVALPRHMTVLLTRIPTGKDPADFLQGESTEAFAAVLNQSVDALEFKWHRTLERFSQTGSTGARREAVMDFLSLVAETCRTGSMDAIQRGLVVNQVADLLQLPSTEVHDLIRRLLRTRVRRDEERSAAGGQAAGRGKVPDPPRSGVAAAWLRVLEVGLNEPGLLLEFPDWTTLPVEAGEADRRLLAIARELSATLGEFRLADVMARCETDEDVQRAAGLASRGAERQNYRATLEAALETLRGRRAQQCGPQDLEALQAVLQGHRHFAPRRMIRAATDRPAPA